MDRGVVERRPCLPILALGVAYLLFAVVHVTRTPTDLFASAVESSLLGAFAVAICYGSRRVARLDLDVREGVEALAVVVAAALVGVVVAATLVAMQQVEGVDLQNVPVLVVTGSAATGTLGVAAAEYRERLRAERSELRDQTVTVARLHRRVTVLNRVLRHNLRNEITVISGYTELLCDAEADVAKRELVETIDEHTRNVDRLSRQARRLHRVWETDETLPVDLADVVRESVHDVAAAHESAAVAVDVPESAVAAVHPHFRFGVQEAIENAIMHNDPGTDVAVTVERTPDAVVVEVVDDGCGIPEDELVAIREGSEDALTHCSGLGLWLQYWTVVLSDGSLAFRENDPSGTVVEMQVPPASA
ncbi:sensor histidine kinase [Halorubellus salinus]|uniref:sensor histidine kinase n=1 Tax=Halorubellus salinus TaxID=755309 RepID=UPI001D06340D|nr:ATP-binding protein [Halorubellus salinus]